jgi:hypothetical protein
VKKNPLKYFLVLLILLTSGTGYLSAGSISLNGSKNSLLNNAYHYTNSAITSSPSGARHKIDIVENEIEEDESDLPVRSFESFLYTPVFESPTIGSFILDHKKEIPFYLIFCTIRI